MGRLQLVQNAAARLITGVRRCEHITPAALAASPQMSGFQDIHPCLSFFGWHHCCVLSWRMYAGYRRWPSSFAVCWQSNVLGQEITQPVRRPLFCHQGQCCGTVCLNSFGNRTSPSDDSNDRWKRFCLVSWTAANCVSTLRALNKNLLTYLLTYKPIGSPLKTSLYCYRSVGVSGSIRCCQ